MFQQIFTSASPPYRGWAELGGAAYNQYLLVPPRLYAEEMAYLTALYVVKERTPFSDFTIHLLGATFMTAWPSYDFRHWIFDGETGAYLGQGTATGPVALSGDVAESIDGSLWAYAALGSTWHEINPLTLVATGEVLDAGLYGMGGGIAGPIQVDRNNNLFLNGSTAAGSPQPYLKTYNFTTGALLKTINLSGQPIQIMAESERHVYVLCDNQMFNLVDYLDGVVLSTFRSPSQLLPGSAYPYDSQVFAYDKYHRRLLAFQMVPENADGSSASVIKGWYPVPLPLHLTKPLPLVAPRINKKIPCLVRLIGDAGEPISGVNVAASATGSGALVTPGGTNNAGAAIVYQTSITAGSTTLTTTATII